MGPAVLAACSTDETAPATPDSNTSTGALPSTAPSPSPTSTPSEDPTEPVAIVDDVIDFALTSQDWEGTFGFVTLRLHAATVDGAEAHYIRTDASEADYADQEGLVFVPRLRALLDEELTGQAYTFDDAHPTVLSTEPGREDFTPAFHVNRVTWVGDPRALGSVTDVEDAVASGDVEVEETGVVINAPLVVWSTGQLPVDGDLAETIGSGQLIAEPDLEAGEVTFKLHECYPGSRYILTDTSAPPMAEGMSIANSTLLAQSGDVDAAGRVNVFMGGIEGPGPMGFQPSVFDARAGDPVWSPYWDHLTYVWADDAEPRVLEDEEAVHAARDAGELEEFVGTPDSGGQGFVVNCPVPVIAPNTFSA